MSVGRVVASATASVTTTAGTAAASGGPGPLGVVAAVVVAGVVAVRLLPWLVYVLWSLLGLIGVVVVAVVVRAVRRHLADDLDDEDDDLTPADGLPVVVASTSPLCAVCGGLAVVVLEAAGRRMPLCRSDYSTARARLEVAASRTGQTVTYAEPRRAVTGR